MTKRSWWLHGRQLLHIIGNTHQTPLRFHLLKASQVESSETHVLFNDPEHWLYLDRTPGTQALPDLTGEVGSGLAAVFQ